MLGATEARILRVAACRQEVAHLHLEVDEHSKSELVDCEGAFQGRNEWLSLSSSRKPAPFICAEQCGLCRPRLTAPKCSSAAECMCSCRGVGSCVVRCAAFLLGFSVLADHLEGACRLTELTTSALVSGRPEVFFFTVVVMAFVSAPNAWLLSPDGHLRCNIARPRCEFQTQREVDIVTWLPQHQGF